MRGVDPDLGLHSCDEEASARPEVFIDYAVMERTADAVVMPPDAAERCRLVVLAREISAHTRRWKTSTTATSSAIKRKNSYVYAESGPPGLPSA